MTTYADVTSAETHQNVSSSASHSSAYNPNSCVRVINSAFNTNADDDDDIAECTVIRRAPVRPRPVRAALPGSQRTNYQHQQSQSQFSGHASFVRVTKSLRSSYEQHRPISYHSRNAQPPHTQPLIPATRSINVPSVLSPLQVHLQSEGDDDVSPPETTATSAPTTTETEPANKRIVVCGGRRRRRPGYNRWLRSGIGEFDFTCSNNAAADDDSNSEDEWVGDNRRLWPVDAILDYAICDALIDERVYPISRAAHRPVLSAVEKTAEENAYADNTTAADNTDENKSVRKTFRLYFLTKFLGFSSSMHRWIPAALILDNSDNATKIPPEMKAQLDRDIDRRQRSLLDTRNTSLYGNNNSSNFGEAKHATDEAAKKYKKFPLSPEYVPSGAANGTSPGHKPFYTPRFTWNALAGELHETDFWRGNPDNIVGHNEWRQWHSVLEEYEQNLRLASTLQYDDGETGGTTRPLKRSRKTGPALSIKSTKTCDRVSTTTARKVTDNEQTSASLFTPSNKHRMHAVTNTRRSRKLFFASDESVSPLSPLLPLREQDGQENTDGNNDAELKAAAAVETEKAKDETSFPGTVKPLAITSPQRPSFFSSTLQHKLPVSTLLPSNTHFSTNLPQRQPLLHLPLNTDAEKNIGKIRLPSSLVNVTTEPCNNIAAVTKPSWPKESDIEVITIDDDDDDQPSLQQCVNYSTGKKEEIKCTITTSLEANSSETGSNNAVMNAAVDS